MKDTVQLITVHLGYVSYFNNQYDHSYYQHLSSIILWIVNMHVLILHGKLMIASPCNEGMEKCIEHFLLNNHKARF